MLGGRAEGAGGATTKPYLCPPPPWVPAAHHARVLHARKIAVRWEARRRLARGGCAVTLSQLGDTGASAHRRR